MTFLDSNPYPWAEAVGRELYRTFLSQYPNPRAAVHIAILAGLNEWDIDPSGSATDVWMDVLGKSSRRKGRLRALVESANEENPTDLFAALLADQPPPMSAEPLSDSGAPQFVHDRDTITEPEALLFRDDLSLSIGLVRPLIDTLRKLVDLAPAVCKLTIRAGGIEQYGTAFRIGPDLLLTNWHVVHSKIDNAPATMITAEFGFEDDSTGRPIAPVPINCDPAPVDMDQADDWAVIRAAEPLQSAWPTINSSATVRPDRGHAAFIIQHPMGQRKRIGFVRNQISYVDDRIVQYLTDTDVGSSGAPVFDAAGNLIALHHAGGRPEEVAGKPPIRKNEGIRISRVPEAYRTAAGASKPEA